MDSAMPCKPQRTSGNTFLKALEGPKEKNCHEHVQGEILSNDHTKKKKTVDACVCEAHESIRHRIQETQNKDHEDHIAEHGYNSMSLYNLVHKNVPLLHADKTADAKAAVDNEWENL